jgi:hypothetical protein
MADVEFTLDVRDVTENLSELLRNVPAAVSRALYEEMQVEKEESMRRTPVEFGALKRSHVVHEPVISGDEITVMITVGGVAAPYALDVHEDLEAFHDDGEAKFLESTIRESAGHMASRIAARMNFNRLV